MSRIKRFSRAPFGSALIGGLVVGLFGWAAIAAGWIASPDATPATTTVTASSQTEPIADAEQGGSMPIADIYERTSPGVVHISSTIEGTAAPTPYDPFGGTPQQQTATGSGFVIDSDGDILTNAHVVEGATKVEVTLDEDSDPLPAEVIGQDASTDVAVIKIEPPAEGLTVLELAPDASVTVGDPVLAIGNPFGLDDTATAGIVSALQREISSPNGFTIQGAIQTDAPINPGNSGGPLINADGQVIGINSQIESGGSAEGNVGIGFAVPIETARRVADQLISDGTVEHAYLGISGADMTAELAGVLNLEVDQGALVQSVQKDSPADKAGLAAGDTTVQSADGQQIVVGGDLITEVDGEPIDGMDDIVAAVDSHQPGDQIELTVVHGGETKTVQVTLANRPAQATG